MLVCLEWLSEGAAAVECERVQARSRCLPSALWTSYVAPCAAVTRQSNRQVESAATAVHEST
jgi:hypothetical protein